MSRVIYGFAGGVLTMIFGILESLKRSLLCNFNYECISSYFETLGEKINNRLNNRDYKPKEKKKEAEKSKNEKDAPKDERGYTACEKAKSSIDKVVKRKVKHQALK